MELVPIDNNSRLFISPDIDDWEQINKENIQIIVDVDGGLDIGIPTIPNYMLYIYFPFSDYELPDVERLKSLSKFCAELYNKGYKILVHCAMGYNRSALIAAMILTNLGYSGKDAVEIIRNKRKGALYNPIFYNFLINI